MAPFNVLFSGCFALIQSVHNYFDKNKIIFRLQSKTPASTFVLLHIFLYNLLINEICIIQ